MRLRPVAAALCAAAAVACSEPPHKEMHEARGAIAAARAAGAQTYAADEYRDAQRALDQSNQAVTDRDYRLALRYALDARERAQDAARAAADRKAEARGNAERALGAAEVVLREAERRLAAARAARMRPRELAPAVKAIDGLRKALQEARTSMKKEAYLEVPRRLEPAQEAIAPALKALEARPPARPVRRRR